MRFEDRGVGCWKVGANFLEQLKKKRMCMFSNQFKNMILIENYQCERIKLPMW